MATAVVAIVVAGFTPTYYLKPLFATPALHDPVQGRFRPRCRCSRADLALRRIGTVSTDWLASVGACRR
jgi:hypothetical protein